jgi:hypothetical protein
MPAKRRNRKMARIAFRSFASGSVARHLPHCGKEAMP